VPASFMSHGAFGVQVVRHLLREHFQGLVEPCHLGLCELVPLPLFPLCPTRLVLDIVVEVISIIIVVIVNGDYLSTRLLLILILVFVLPLPLPLPLFPLRGATLSTPRLLLLNSESLLGGGSYGC
jgi:hypothetical protein